MTAIRLALSFVIVTALASCGLPRSAPTKSEILADATDKGGQTFVIEVTETVIAQVNEPATGGFPNSFLTAATINPDVIRRGDTLSMQVYENVDQGVFGSFGGAGGVDGLYVDQDGMIFVPYVGRMKAAGKTLENLRVEMTETLSALTPDPQVRLSRSEGVSGAAVTILGNGGSGLFPLEPQTLRLSDMLTAAGAIDASVDPVSVRVSVSRGSRTGEISLFDLLQDDSNNIALRPGDRISIQEDERKFTLMGALGGRGIVNFPEPDFSILEAISYAGGLDGSVSDPKGIFILRNEEPGSIQKLANDPSITCPQRVVYVVDLTKPNGIFIAREFMMKDDDTLLVTEAPFTQWTKVLNAILNTSSSVQNLTTIGDFNQ